MWLYTSLDPDTYVIAGAVKTFRSQDFRFHGASSSNPVAIGPMVSAETWVKVDYWDVGAEAEGSEG